MYEESGDAMDGKWQEKLVRHVRVWQEEATVWVTQASEGFGRYRWLQTNTYTTVDFMREKILTHDISKVLVFSNIWLENLRF